MSMNTESHHPRFRQNRIGILETTDEHTCVVFHVTALINRGYAFFFNRHSNEATSKMAARNVRISTVKAEREKPLLLETVADPGK